jgi:N-acetylated-alpha-linked acidic dipeptidase
MTRFGDPGLRYMTAMVEVWGRMALRLANAAIIPYDLGHYASTVARFVDALEEQSGVKAHLDLSGLRAALEEWSREAEAMQSAAREALEAEVPDPRLERLNRSLLQVERQFLLEEGIPDRPWFKHALYAPRYTYAAMSLPGIQEAVEAENWELARKQSDQLAERLRAVTEAVRQAADRLQVGSEKIAAAGDSPTDDDPE